METPIAHVVITAAQSIPSPSPRRRILPPPIGEQHANMPPPANSRPLLLPSRLSPNSGPRPTATTAPTPPLDEDLPQFQRLMRGRGEVAGGLDLDWGSCDLTTVSGMREFVLGRKLPVRSMLGGGKLADVVLWRNKKASTGVVIWMTFIWVLVEWGGFNVLPLICYSLICLSTMLTFRSELTSMCNKLYAYFKQQAHIECCIESWSSTQAEVNYPNDLIMLIKATAVYVVKEASKAFQSTPVEKNLSTFVMVNAVFWIVSIVSSWFDFVTLLYMVFLILHASLALYGRYEEDIDSAIVMALLNIHRHYLVLNSTLLRTIKRFYFIRMKPR